MYKGCTYFLYGWHTGCIKDVHISCMGGVQDV